MLNLIVVIGRLGKDPSMEYSQNGTAVTKFSIATDDGWGENKSTTWHNVVSFKQTAEAWRSCSGQTHVFHEGATKCDCGKRFAGPERV